MLSSSSERLTRREREIMHVLHELGDRASAEEIRKRLSDPPSYSAVRAMLVKLENKGYVRHHEEGLRYVYVPTTSRGASQRKALRQMIKVFFDGSPRQTATALLKEEAWTNEELDALQAEIEAVRKNRRRRV